MVLDNIFNVGQVRQLIHLSQLTELGGLPSDEEMLLICIRQLGNAWQVTSRKECLWTQVMVDDRIGPSVRSILGELNFNIADYYDAVFGETYVTKRYVGLGRALRLMYLEGFPLRRCLTDKLALCLVTVSLLDGMPEYLKETEPLPPALYRAVRELNNGIIMDQTIQPYQSLHQLTKIVYGLFDDQAVWSKDVGQLTQLYNTIDIGVMSVVTHFLLIILRRHAELDAGVSKSMWRQSGAGARLSCELARTVKLML